MCFLWTYMCVVVRLTPQIQSVYSFWNTENTKDLCWMLYQSLNGRQATKQEKKKQFKSVPCQPRFIVHLAQQTIQGWIKRSKCVHIGGQILIAPSFCSACSLLKIHVHIKMITIMKYQTTTGSSWITNVTASWCTASHRSMSMKLEMKLLISVLVCSLACVSTDNTYHSC